MELASQASGIRTMEDLGSNILDNCISFQLTFQGGLSMRLWYIVKN